jgi:hypothetical protein
MNNTAMMFAPPEEVDARHAVVLAAQVAGQRGQQTTQQPVLVHHCHEAGQHLQAADSRHTAIWVFPLQLYDS